MGAHRTLGLPGRARRVEDGGVVLGLDRHVGQGDVGLGGSHQLGEGDDRHRRTGQGRTGTAVLVGDHHGPQVGQIGQMGRQAIETGRVDEGHLGPRVGQPVVELGARPPRVEGHDHAAGRRPRPRTPWPTREGCAWRWRPGHRARPRSARAAPWRWWRRCGSSPRRWCARPRRRDSRCRRGRGRAPARPGGWPGQFFQTRVGTPRISTSSISNICPGAVMARVASSIDMDGGLGHRGRSASRCVGAFSGCRLGWRAGRRRRHGVGDRRRRPPGVGGVDGGAGGDDGVDPVEDLVGQGRRRGLRACRSSAPWCGGR